MRAACQKADINTPGRCTGETRAAGRGHGQRGRGHGGAAAAAGMRQKPLPNAFRSAQRGLSFLWLSGQTRAEQLLCVCGSGAPEGEAGTP